MQNIFKTILLLD